MRDDITVMHARESVTTGHRDRLYRQGLCTHPLCLPSTAHLLAVGNVDRSWEIKLCTVQSSNLLSPATWRNAVMTGRGAQPAPPSHSFLSAAVTSL